MMTTYRTHSLVISIIDGIDDLIIGASGVDGEFNVDYSKDAGAAYVVFGSRSLQAARSISVI